MLIMVIMVMTMVMVTLMVMSMMMIIMMITNLTMTMVMTTREKTIIMTIVMIIMMVLLPNLSLVCPRRVAPAKTQLMSKRVNRRRIRVQAKKRQKIFSLKLLARKVLKLSEKSAQISSEYSHTLTSNGVNRRRIRKQGKRGEREKIPFKYPQTIPKTFQE